MDQTKHDKIEEIVQKAVMAAAVFDQYDQAQTDRIVTAVFRAAFNKRIELARMAQEETGLGVWEHKVIKNVIATQLVYESIKNLRTVGIVSQDERSGITEIAQPLGPILAITPVTNPTSTALFKILICLKTRNPIIISPHRKSVNCISETARICYDAALAADAPEDCIQVVTEHSREGTQALMSHRRMALILATGGTGLVGAAYSSGTPAIGVGPGNVPVFIDASADIPFAVEQIVFSKTFDNGTICASEQAVVMERALVERVREEFIRQHCHFLSPAEIKQVEKVAIDLSSGKMSAEVVGQSAEIIAARAGISVPAGTRILMCELTAVGEQEPLSGEVLAPILAFYAAGSHDEAAKICIALNYRGGIGHTVSIFANAEERIVEFSQLMNAGRVLVNTPSAPGAVGGMYNTLLPSLTLGCGSGGKNITTENVSAQHLINIKRVCRRRCNEKWFDFDQARYLDPALDAETCTSAYHRNH